LAEQTLNEILKTLSGNQLAFVAHRINMTTDKEAAEACGVPPGSVYNWPNKEDVRQAVQLVKEDSVMLGREQLRRLVTKAVSVVESHLDKNSLGAAVEVFNRTGLEAGATLNLQGGGLASMLAELRGLAPDDE